METITEPYKMDYPGDQVFSVPMSAIQGRNGDFNSRGDVKPGQIIELAREIRQKGLIQPITIEPRPSVDRHFRIVAGYRRYAAHVYNKATHINALIRCGLTEPEARMINLVENTQREDLDIAQEAKSLRYFEMAGWTDSQIASRVSKSPTWVRSRLDFLQLPSDVQDEVVVGLIPLSEVKKILEARDAGGDDAMWSYAKAIKTDKLTNKKTAREVKKTIKVNEKRIRSQEDIFALQLQIQETTGNPEDFAAMILGWAAGYVDDQRVFAELSDYIRGHYDKHLDVPTYARQEAAAL